MAGGGGGADGGFGYSGGYGGRSVDSSDAYGGRGGGRRPFGGGGGGGGRVGGQRDGGSDWTCPNASCGNVNFAKRSECNKCRAAKPGGPQTSPPDYRGQGASGSYGRSAHRSQGDPEESRGMGTPQGGGSYRDRKGYSGAPQGSVSRDDGKAPGSYGRPEVSEVKQCDGNCDETCSNSRIYMSGLPLDVTADELRELFGGIGQVARIKQKRGYKDQWPWNIKIYQDESGKNKGDAVLSYEDPLAAHSAGGFYDGHDMRGHMIKVTMAEKYAPRPEVSGRRGGYSGGSDRRDGNNYRSRPY